MGVSRTAAPFISRLLRLTRGLSCFSFCISLFLMQRTAFIKHCLPLSLVPLVRETFPSKSHLSLRLIQNFLFLFLFGLSSPEGGEVKGGTSRVGSLSRRRSNQAEKRRDVVQAPPCGSPPPSLYVFLLSSPSERGGGGSYSSGWEVDCPLPPVLPSL